MQWNAIQCSERNSIQCSETPSNAVKLIQCSETPSNAVKLHPVQWNSSNTVKLHPMQWNAIQCSETSSNAVKETSSNAVKLHLMQWNAIQCNERNSIQCSETPSNAVKCHPMQRNSIQCSETPSSIVKRHPMQWNAIQYSKTPSNAVKCHPIQWNAIQCSETPSNIVKRHPIQWNAIQCSEMPSNTATVVLQSVMNSSKSDSLAQRIENLNAHFTNSIYRNVCRSLFEKDKLLFSFILCIGILRGRSVCRQFTTKLASFSTTSACVHCLCTHLQGTFQMQVYRLVGCYSSVLSGILSSLFGWSASRLCAMEAMTVCWCRNEIDDDVWRFLLTGGVALDNPYPNPASDWMTDKSWSEIVRASDLPCLKRFMCRKL